MTYLTHFGRTTTCNGFGRCGMTWCPWCKKSRRRSGKKKRSRRRKKRSRRRKRRSRFGLWGVSCGKKRRSRSKRRRRKKRRSRRRRSRFGASGPGYAGATSFKNGWSPYFGGKEPFIQASEWWYPNPGSQGQLIGKAPTHYQSPGMVRMYNK